MNTNMTPAKKAFHTLTGTVERIYSMIRATERLKSNKNMADFIEWIPTRHTDLV